MFPYLDPNTSTLDIDLNVTVMRREILHPLSKSTLRLFDLLGRGGIAAQLRNALEQQEI